MNGSRTKHVRPVSVFVVGPSEAPEFASVVDELASHLGVELLQRESLADASARNAAPDLVVLLQQRPEESSPQQVLKVLDEFPLSRLIVCCGPWCDSDGRTRSLWPLAVRVRAELAAARIRHELAVLSESTPTLPWTGNRDEAYLFDHDSRFDSSATVAVDAQLRVAVVSPDPTVGDWLKDVLESADLLMRWSPQADADLILWDADPWTPENATALNKQRLAAPTSPIIALVGYNRPHIDEQIIGAGATQVVAKLSSITQLLRVIAENADGPTERQRLPIVIRHQTA